MKTAGYSGKNLSTKLLLKPGMRCLFIDHPAQLKELLADVWRNLDVETKPTGESRYEWIFLSVKDFATLDQQFSNVAKMLEKTGKLWVSWPKKSSRLYKDLSENMVRELGLKLGIVDIKVCAIDEDWSGLLFVHRK